jgi:hypothetical protein
LSGSEALFTEQEPEEYDPCFESTLSDPTIKAKKSKPEKSTRFEGPALSGDSFLGVFCFLFLADPKAGGLAKVDSKRGL